MKLLLTESIVRMSTRVGTCHVLNLRSKLQVLLEMVGRTRTPLSQNHLRTQVCILQPVHHQILPISK